MKVLDTKPGTISAVSDGSVVKALPDIPKSSTISGPYGGEGGIRTHGTGEGTTVFETAPIDHSGTSPQAAGYKGRPQALQLKPSETGPALAGLRRTPPMQSSAASGACGLH